MKLERFRRTGLEVIMEAAGTELEGGAVMAPTGLESCSADEDIMAADRDVEAASRRKSDLARDREERWRRKRSTYALIPR
jgi:hypothetical protein